MRKLHVILALVALVVAQPSFARYHSMSTHESKACSTIVHACLDAGYSDKRSTSKRFWQDCMKPIILGQNVHGVDIDSSIAHTCRTNKIAELKRELRELQSAARSSN